MPSITTGDSGPLIELAGDNASNASADWSSPGDGDVGGTPMSTRSSLKSSSAGIAGVVFGGVGEDGMVIRSAMGMSSSSPSHADRETFWDIQSGRGSSDTSVIT